MSTRVDMKNPATFPDGWEFTPGETPWYLGGDKRVLRYCPKLREWYGSQQLDPGDFWQPMPAPPEEAP